MQPVPRLGPRTKGTESKGHEFESSLAKENYSENASLHIPWYNAVIDESVTFTSQSKSINTIFEFFKIFV